MQCLWGLPNDDRGRRLQRIQLRGLLQDSHLHSARSRDQRAVRQRGRRFRLRLLRGRQYLPERCVCPSAELQRHQLRRLLQRADLRAGGERDEYAVRQRRRRRCLRRVHRDQYVPEWRVPGSGFVQRGQLRGVLQRDNLRSGWERDQRSVRLRRCRVCGVHRDNHLPSGRLQATFDVYPRVQLLPVLPGRRSRVRDVLEYDVRRRWKRLRRLHRVLAELRLE